MSQRRHGHHPLVAFRPAILAISKAIFAVGASAAPVRIMEKLHDGNDEEDDTKLWVLYVASIFLVLLGGAFAGLTIALMGQDSIYLQVIAKDPSEPQQKNAKRVLHLLHKGKHWVLVTLLLSNVIVNESLPVVLDRCLGGGVAAVVGSTVLIVIFGEVVPQSVCVRFGLAIGGYMSKPVLLLMYLMAPVAWPTAKLLDWALGEDHGTIYKKSGLKTLVTLHRTLGDVSNRLNEDEVTIIGAVLDLKEKPVHAVMTPMDDVFVMSEDTVLDQDMIDNILREGYSRIPIHEAGNPTNFIGMLLVKILITYDPEDGKSVRDFALATLPETRPETSCLDIINFFQEGKSHMVLVSESPGEDHGAIGVVTLEDVIEELIGEEIIDESDVYIDVHKAIRRMAPAPKARFQRRFSHSTRYTNEDGPDNKSSDETKVGEEQTSENNETRKKSTNALSNHGNDAGHRSGSPGTLLLRRSSAGVDGRMENVPVRASFDDIKQHLKHLGPSNPASKPRATRSTTVKVKPGIVIREQPHPRHAAAEETIPEASQNHEEDEGDDDDDGDGDETTSLLRGSKVVPKDGVKALAQSYGATGSPSFPRSLEDSNLISSRTRATENTNQEDQSTQTLAQPGTRDAAAAASGGPDNRTQRSSSGASDNSPSEFAAGSYPHGKSLLARSGSITEQIVENRGFKKTILETTSSDEERNGTSVYDKVASRSNLSLPLSNPRIEEEEASKDGPEQPKSATSAVGSTSTGDSNNQGGASGSGKKKNRRKKKKGKF